METPEPRPEIFVAATGADGGAPSDQLLQGEGLAPRPRVERDDFSHVFAGEPEYEIDVLRLRSTYCKLKGRVMVDGQLAAEAVISSAMVDR